MSDAAPTNPPPVRPRGLRRRLAIAAMLTLATLAGTEAFLRIRYGLGDPPVVISDAVTEYRMAPNAHYRRLEHRMDFNAYSMRSDPITPTRTSAAERRVLVMGDSVVNGGAWTDQSELATSILQARLRRDATPNSIVGNISAGSWGPQNLLGYATEFGLFDADVVAIVVSSHDAFDEVTSLPSVSGVPSQTYWFALSEAWDRLRPSLTPSAPPTTRPDDPPPNHHGGSGPCVVALGELIDRVRVGGATPLVFFHYERTELDRADEGEGHRLLRAGCAAHGVEPISLAPAFRAAIAAGENPYRDEIHPNAAGQRAMAAALAPPIEAALRDRGR